MHRFLFASTIVRIPSYILITTIFLISVVGVQVGIAQISQKAVGSDEGNAWSASEMASMKSNSEGLSSTSLFEDASPDYEQDNHGLKGAMNVDTTGVKSEPSSALQSTPPDGSVEIYSEDFSDDPGYEVQYSENTEGEAEVYWDDAGKSYYALVKDQSSEWWSVGKSPVFSTVDSSDAFTVSFKFNPVQPDWGHYPAVYFVDSDSGSTPRGLARSQAFNFDISWSDGVYKKFELSNADGDEFSSPTIPAENEWYSVTIEYHPESETVDLAILREDGTTFVDETGISIPISGSFDQVMIGETGAGPTYGDQAQIRVDDIVVSTNSGLAPTSLSATTSDGQIGLVWSPGGDSSTAGYNIYRSTESFSDISDATKLNNSLISDTVYTDSEVTNGTEYFYRVTAVDGEGNESGLSGQARAALQDLKLIGLEVNQSVQDWQNSVPLIEGKTTVVRAHIQNRGPDNAKVKGIRLEGTRNGSPLGPPLKAENNATFRAPSETSDEDTITVRRFKWHESLNFIIRNDQWLTGTVNLKLIGDGLECSSAPEISEDCEIQVDFQSTPTLSVKFYRIKWYDLSGELHQPSKQEIRDIAESVAAMYPVEDIHFETAELLAFESPISAGNFQLVTVNQKLETMRALDIASGASTARLYYGVIADAEVGGLALSVRGNVASGNDTPITVAHELGHLLGRPHAVNADDNGNAIFPPGFKKGYCGSLASPLAQQFPYSEEFEGVGEIAAIGPSGRDSEMWGIDTNEMQIRPYVSTGELMSYCNPRWVSDYTYEKLRSSIVGQFGNSGGRVLASRSGAPSASLSSSGPSKTQQQEYTLVRGRIELSDSLSGEDVEFLPFSSITASQAVADSLTPEQGDYTLQAIDEQGSVVEEVSFEPDLGVAKQITDTASFAVPIPKESSISEVQVRYDDESQASRSVIGSQANGNVIGEKEASPNPPSVTVESPNGGENLDDEQVTVEWSAEDPDGDSLSYAVQFSQNGGNTWSTLNSGLSDTTLTVDRSTLGGTSNGLVRVQASDGFNTARDASDGTFSTSNVAPNATIFSPAEGMVTDTTSLITLYGSANDVEDGSISGPALKWQTASGDSLGIGETLDVSAANFSLGSHTIELVATDSVGASDTASVSIRVALSSDPSLLASRSALVESDTLYDFGPTSTNIDFDSTSGSATVAVELYDSSPVGTDSIPQTNVSEYRILIGAEDDLSVGPSTEVRFESDSLGGIGDPAKVQIYRRSSPGNGPFTALNTKVDSMGTPSDPSDDVIYAETSEFGEFVLASNSEPLPVELARFEANLNGKDAVRLSWTTASETGNASFRVQRKTGESEETWTTVGSIEGSGTTTEEKSYRYVDESLPYEADRLTYRLKQVDTDGSTGYSKEVTIERGVKEVQLLGTYPNPAHSSATIRYAVPERQEVNIYLYDVLGRRVQTVVDGEKKGRHKRQLDTSRLASGVYFLRLRARETTKTQKLTVVR